MLFLAQPFYSHDQNEVSILEKVLNKEYLIFSENVNMRKEPHLKSEVILQLQPGDSIIIVEKTKKLFTLNNNIGYWYRAKAYEKEGYIWGALVSDNHLSLSNFKILFRNSGPDQGILEIKSIQDKKILSSLALHPGPVANEDWSFEIYDAQSFKPEPGNLLGFRFSLYSELGFSYPIEKILSVNPIGDLKVVYTWYPGSCDFPNCYEASLVFPGKKLSAKKTIHRKEYVGIDNSILQVNRNYDAENSDINLYNTTTSIWDGKTFTEKK